MYESDGEYSYSNPFPRLKDPRKYACWWHPVSHDILACVKQDNFRAAEALFKNNIEMTEEESEECLKLAYQNEKTGPKFVKLLLQYGARGDKKLFMQWLKTQIAKPDIDADVQIIFDRYLDSDEKKDPGLNRAKLIGWLMHEVCDDSLAELEQCESIDIKFVIRKVGYDVRKKLEVVDIKYKKMYHMLMIFLEQEYERFLRIHGFSGARKYNNLYELRSDYGKISFNVAAFTGDIATLSRILDEEGKGVVNQQLNEVTPLHCAAVSGQLSAVNFLVANGANSCAINKDGKKPFEVATDSEVRRALIDAKNAQYEKYSPLEKDVQKAIDDDDKSALVTALLRALEKSKSFDDFPIRRELLERSLPLLSKVFWTDDLVGYLKCVNTAEWSLFFFVKHLTPMETIDRLKEIAGKIDSVENQKNLSHLDVMGIVLGIKCGVSPTSEAFVKLLEASDNPAVSRFVQTLVKLKIMSANEKFPGGNTPLHLCHCTELAKCLVQYGADIMVLNDAREDVFHHGDPFKAVIMYESALMLQRDIAVTRQEVLQQSAQLASLRDSPILNSMHSGSHNSNLGPVPMIVREATQLGSRN